MFTLFTALVKIESAEPLFVIHGSAIEVFDIPNWNSGYRWFDGINVDGEKISAQAMRVKIPQHYQCQIAESNVGLGEIPFYDDVSHFESSSYNLFFMNDETMQNHEHIVVFLEHGSHEPWPNKTGSFPGAPNHNGNSYSFLPTKVNLLDRTTDEPFYYFGGKFSDPAGLMRHQTWFLEFDDVAVPPAIRTDLSPYLDHYGTVRWPPTPKDYLGNRNTMEVHGLRYAKGNCRIDDILPSHKVYFNSLEEAHDQNYDNCAKCNDPQTSKH